jgi:FtsZ-binding cell division protein ZapB
MRLTLSRLLAVFISFAVVGFVLNSNTFAADAKISDPKEQIAKLQDQIETLRAENEALKKENQSLRRMISGRPATAETPTQVQSAPKTTVQPATIQPKATDYWITTSSGVRHNSSCRYYQNSKGRACGPNEGRACKICGG